MKQVLKYIKPYWYFAMLAPLFMICEVVFDLLQPRLMSKIVDNGILSKLLSASEKTEIVIKYGLLMLLFLVVGGLCGILSAACASAASNSMGNDLRKATFSRIVNLSCEQTDKFTTGSLITRITNDITQIQDFVQMAVRMFFRALTMFVGGLIFMFTTSTIFGYVLLIILPIELVVIIIFLKRVTPLFKVIQSKVDKVNSVVQENVNGARVVKAFNGEEKESVRFSDANTDLADNSYHVSKILSLVGPIMTIFLYGISIAIIYFGGLEISNNIELVLANNTEVMSVGKVMASLTYVSMILMSVMQLAMIFQNITRASVSSKRICEVLNTKPVINDNPLNYELKETGTVKFDNVNFSYPNYSSANIINNLNLDVKKGETLAIIGATGSGKSTIVNLITRLYDVTGGTLYVDGMDVKKFNLEDLRTRVSIVLQRTELFGGSIKDNIKWGKKDATDEEVQNVSSIAQVNDFIETLQDQYDTIIGEKGSSLSGGQKQRIAIARALIKKPEILIFDDSTSALDLETEAHLYKALRENLGDTTVILIAQRVASCKNADRIAVIDEGKLVACDTHDVLINNCNIYIDIYNSQLKRGDDNE